MAEGKQLMRIIFITSTPNNNNNPDSPVVMPGLVFRSKWDHFWDHKRKPADNQRVTGGAGNKVYLGIIRCITGV